MALLMNQPTVVRWPDNPASMLARYGIEGLDLGFAQPSLNGGSMIQGRHMGMAMPPITFRSPALSESAIPFGGGGHEARVTAPINQLSWEITIPPDPADGVRWVSEIPSMRVQAEEVVARLPGAKPVLPNEPAWKIVVHPLPDAARFMAHVLFHEEQHVVDHQYLASQIIGPWDRWLTIADQKRLRFRNASVFTLRSSIHNPGNYATGTERIFRYWQTAIERSGTLYHATDEGGPPAIQVMASTGTERLPSGEMALNLSIEPAMLLTASPYLPSGPHGGFTLKRFSATGQNPISGNEIPVEYGPCPARTIDFLGIAAATNSAVIQIP